MNMKEEIKKGFGIGVGFLLSEGLVYGIARVLAKKKKLKESETNKSKENTTETEES